MPVPPGDPWHLEISVHCLPLLWWWGPRCFCFKRIIGSFPIKALNRMQTLTAAICWCLLSRLWSKEFTGLCRLQTWWAVLQPPKWLRLLNMHLYVCTFAVYLQTWAQHSLQLWFWYNVIVLASSLVATWLEHWTLVQKDRGSEPGGLCQDEELAYDTCQINMWIVFHYGDP